MTVFDAIVLGAAQGLAESVPASRRGHLAPPAAVPATMGMR
jgi:undecaprenyl pyrophosphate phosphatase UppP